MDMSSYYSKDVIGHNYIGREGAKAFAAALLENRTLRVLKLGTAPASDMDRGEPPRERGDNRACLCPDAEPHIVRASPLYRSFAPLLGNSMNYSVSDELAALELNHGLTKLDLRSTASLCQNCRRPVQKERYGQVQTRGNSNALQNAAEEHHNHFG